MFPVPDPGPSVNAEAGSICLSAPLVRLYISLRLPEGPALSAARHLECLVVPEVIAPCYLKDEDKKFPPILFEIEVLKDGTVETDAAIDWLWWNFLPSDIIARLHSEGDA